MAPKSSPKPSKSSKATSINDEQLQSFTQENFEKELKALASKAQEETTTRFLLSQLWVLARSATLLSLAAIYSNVSQLTLSPVYGSYPAGIWHSKGVMTACFLGWSSNLFIRRYLPIRRPVQLLPIIAAYIPVAQYFLFKLSGYMGANFGPPITEGLTFLPLLILSVSCTATTLDDLELTSGRWPWISDAAPGIVSYIFFKTVEYVSANQISQYIGQSIIFTRLGMQIVLQALYSAFAPSKLLLWILPALFHTALFNIHVPTPYAINQLNSTMNANGWSILERKESLTGYVSVIESLTMGNGFRAMRCDHSLLGGEWLVNGEKAKGLAEPIYGIFVMLEAIRLIEVEKPIKDKDASALVIGLGIGTTPAALISHGIHTTLVEIDPVVVDFAQKYFSLPEPQETIIDDAVSVASNFAAQGKKFNYIFLKDLHDILEPGGVIAINFAGDFLLPPFVIIHRTIRSLFSTCRIYREAEAPTDQHIAETGQDFTNMVIFCTKPLSETPSLGPETSAPSITFRKPIEKDFLRSNARRAFLLPKWEIEDEELKLGEEKGEEAFAGVLRRNETGRLQEWQVKSAKGHWGVMRGVLPGGVWIDW
ncbi:spermine spermidine synthase [Botrytis cinerea]